VFASGLFTRDVIKQKAMDERRRHPRTEINEPGLVSAAGSVMRCTVHNISPEGAAIDVENPAFVPARFRLVMHNGATVHECSIAWIQKNRIGVAFIAVPQAGADKGKGG
jgi:hypothetical protein